MPLIGAGNFFDGFGFAQYMERFDWKPIPMDAREAEHPPRNPLLPFLKKLSKEIRSAGIISSRNTSRTTTGFFGNSTRPRRAARR